MRLKAAVIALTSLDRTGCSSGLEAVESESFVKKKRNWIEEEKMDSELQKEERKTRKEIDEQEELEVKGKRNEEKRIGWKKRGE